MPYKDPIKNAAAKKKWKQANKHKDREYYLKNKEAIDIRKKAWREANPDKWKARRREQTLRVYGLTPDSYYDLIQEQEGACKLCGFMPDEPLCVDHCHVTGRNRALLCRECNTALGLFADNPALMRRAADYVEKHQASPN